MKETNWELIAKHLAKETNPDEELEFHRLMDTDDVFKQEFKASQSTWDRIEIPTQSYDKTRIQNLRDRKIKTASQQRLIRASMKYAAVFIVFAIAALFIYNDLNSTITIVANDTSNTEVTLPDGSHIMMKKEAQITYSNSILKGFDRKIELEGQAYFEITKSHGENFIVKTNDYNIEVLGTKFNVNTNNTTTSVVLTEGSVALNHFNNDNIKNTTIKPGQMASLNHDSQQLSISTVNPKIYTTWTQHKLNFDNFSIEELSDIFRIHYGKLLVVDESLQLDNRISGSAPTDDFNLIIKGLSLVLNREIIERNDTIFIK